MRERSLTFASLMLLCIAVAAFGSNTEQGRPYQAKDAAAFLSSDGRFDLQAVRNAGFEGSIDLSDFIVGFAPETGEPILVPKADQLLSPNCDSLVEALTVYGTDLIAAGALHQAGCVPVGCLAGYDGTNWNWVGCGVNNIFPIGIYTAFVYGGNLIVGGYFFGVGCWPGTPANCIAQWNGSSWSALGTGLSGGGPFTCVYAMTRYYNDLIVGGNFTQAGGVTANAIARWNGISWSSLGTGMGSPMIPYVLSLTVLGTDLVAGGNFTQAGGVAANCVAKWNGTSWSALGSGTNMDVYALTVYGSDLIAGGAFTQAGGVAANRIAKWNGVSWSALGSGVSGGSFTHVAALLVYNDLVVGGDFTTAGGISANSIANWDGINWTSLGGGVSGGNPNQVLALTKYGADLIVGGNFTQAGAANAKFVARWNGSSWSRVGYICGDVNNDGVINISDVVYLVAYVFASGPAPLPLQSGDCNHDGLVNVSDAVYLVTYIFGGGPPPCVN